MEIPLTYRIHPSTLDMILKILDAERISFQFKYETVHSPAGCFVLTLEKAIANEQCKTAFDVVLVASELELSREKSKMDRLYEMDRDYEKIKSDLKALIFYASMTEPVYKSKEKRKNVHELLHSNLSRNLYPAARKRMH